MSKNESPDKPLGLAAAPPAAAIGASPLLCTAMLPAPPHTTHIHTSWDHGSTPATTPGSAAVLMSAFTFLGRQLLGKSRDAVPALPARELCPILTAQSEQHLLPNAVP